MQDKLIVLRRALHAHPELGFEEHWTSDFIARELDALGLDLHRGLAKTGLVAILKGNQEGLSRLAYRADMDALPIVEKTGLAFSASNGCMHACGHDAHMAVALGLAHLLKEEHPKLRHDIAFIFQPNEEGAPGTLPSGAELMCQEGILERFQIAHVLALHSDPRLDSGIMGLCKGCLWAASGRFELQIEGASAHAAYPEKGQDALWAASELLSQIYHAKARQRAFAPEVLTISKLEAGTTFNVVAADAKLEGIVRGPSRDVLSQLFELIDNCAKSVEILCQVKIKLKRHFGADAVYNDDQLYALAEECWLPTGQGIRVEMNLAAEDFSSFSKRRPCFFAMMGTKPKNKTSMPPAHAADFDIDEAALLPSCLAMRDLILALDKKLDV